MTFSNPAGAARANAHAYTAALLDLLGDRDPLTVQRELLPALRATLGDLDDATLNRPEAPGKWSILEVVQHLVQTELVYAYRYRVALAHDDPVLPGFDQNRWVERLARDGSTVPLALERLAFLREWNLELLEGLTPEELARPARHEERGPEGVRETMVLGAAHDLVHRRQIDRIKSGNRS